MIKLNNVEISQEDLIKEITGNKELMDTLKAKFGKKESRWFVPKEREIYFFLEVDDTGASHFHSSPKFDNLVLKRQQVFRTEEEAEKADQQRMAKVHILKRIAEENAKDGWVCDWGDTKQKKYIFGFDSEYVDLILNCTVYNQIVETGFYMSKTVAEKLREELRTELLEDYKIYLGVE